MAVQKLYPRSTIKRTVKAHSNRNVSKNADILVSLFPFKEVVDIIEKAWKLYSRSRTIANNRCYFALDIPGLHAVYARVSST